MGTTIYLDGPPVRKPAAVANDRRLRVAFLTPGLQRGGAERWIISLCRWMDAQIVGVVSTMPKIDAGMRHELARVDVQVFDHDADPDASRNVLAAADVVICWGIGNLAPYLDGIEAPVVWVSHGACDWTRQLAIHAVGRVNHWVSVSDKARGPIPVAPDQVTVIHNGVDIDRTVPIRGRRAMRKTLGLRDDQIAVGYMGRFSPEKRPTAVAEAVACLPAQYVAVMAGDGWNEERTREAAAQIAPGRVIFAGHHPHVGDILSAFDVWINASPSEGMCLSLIETWLAGVPCVSTPTGAIPELQAVHGQLVYEVPIGADGEQIAEAILAASTDPSAVITDRARRLAWSQFTSPAMAARWIDYLQLVSSRPHAQE
ncbi:MAG: glycosyltransferase family 4 protein [Planctomycetota bacterium]